MLFGACVCQQEEVQPPSMTSACVLATGLAMIDEGMFYPEGGAGALYRAFTYSILAAGGSVFSDTEVLGLELETTAGTGRVTGVRVAMPSGGAVVLGAGKSVVSGLGAIRTYIHLLPQHTVPNAIRQQLSMLSEARPKV